MYKYNVSNHIEKVKNEVAKLLEGDNSGHGLEHINRVLDLSLKFAEKENANKYIVSLIALLHDADDYKLFGMENAEKLTNAKIIWMIAMLRKLSKNKYVMLLIILDIAKD